jgi:hypothetical protein
MAKNKITATVCLFSGRPNPEWEIGVKEYNELLQVIHKLPATEIPTENFLLGYSGVIVKEGAKRIYIFNELISVTQHGGITAYTDAERTIEKRVLHTAPAEITKEIKGLLPEQLR